MGDPHVPTGREGPARDALRAPFRAIPACSSIPHFASLTSVSAAQHRGGAAREAAREYSLGPWAPPCPPPCTSLVIVGTIRAAVVTVGQREGYLCGADDHHAVRLARREPLSREGFGEVLERPALVLGRVELGQRANTTCVRTRGSPRITVWMSAR